MTEVERIVDQMRRAFEGGAWCGSALKEVLADVTPAEAEGAAAAKRIAPESIMARILANILVSPFNKTTDRFLMATAVPRAERPKRRESAR